MILTSLVCLTNAMAQSHNFPDVLQTVEGATINWTELRLEITLSSSSTVGAWHSWSSQEMEVWESIKERFPEVSSAVLIQPGLYARDLMAENSARGQRTLGELEKWHVEETRYHTSGSVDIDAYLDLMPWLGPELREQANTVPIPTIEQGATGIVIDARAVPFLPALSPTISMASGTILCNSQSVSISTLESGSPVQYVSDPADPKANERAGDSPLFVLAQSGSEGTLSLQSGQWETNPALASLVANGNVVIVVQSQGFHSK